MREPGRPVLGVATIGQSPRSDVLPQMLPYLPRDLDIRQAGALDGLSNEGHGYVFAAGHFHAVRAQLGGL